MKVLRRLPPFETAFVAVAAIVASLLMVANQGSQQPPPVDSYSTYDAASGGYRAWYELLQREGARVERFERRLNDLDGRIAMLVWADPLPSDPRGSGASPAELDALEAWVKSGGRLLYLGHDNVAAKSGVLKLPSSTGATHGAVAPVYASSVRAQDVARIAWSKAPARFAHRARDAALVRDKFGTLALRYSYGRGSVTVIADETPFSNAHLGLLDDARFAYFLSAPGNGAVAFDEAAHGYLVPDHWWEIVPRPFLIGVIVAAFALLIAFAGAAVRLGPPLVAPELRDPTSVEFLTSVAALLQRGGGGRQALDDAVRSTRRALAIALGVGDSDERIALSLASAQQRSAYAELIDIARNPALGDAALVRGVELAQRLRKDYSRDGYQRR